MLLHLRHNQGLNNHHIAHEKTFCLNPQIHNLHETENT